MAWTLPYVVSVNEDAPHGLVAGHPRYFEGTKADDGRLNWYANSAIKDIVLTSAVRCRELEDPLQVTPTTGIASFAFFMYIMMGRLKTA